MLKKCLSSILLLYIVLMMMPVVEAVDTTSGAGTVITPENFIEYGDFQVSTEDIAPMYASNKLTFSHSGNYYLKMKDGLTTTSDQIVVDASTVNLIVEDVQVAIPADNVQGAFELRNGSTVNMTLVGDNEFLSGRAYPGIMVTPGETLVIDGDGALRAEGLNTAAGIGGSNFGDKQTAGTIIINGGSIYAKAGLNNGGGAGIGGSAGGGAGTIIINGGDITAIGGSSGAGIGSGATDYSDGGTITIKNATVKAYGSQYDGAGIGCGGNSVSVTVSIENSTVLAISGRNSAGIGNGYGHTYSSAFVEIDDQSEVIAVSDSRYNNAIDADSISVAGHMLMATYKSIVAADTNTSIMKDGTEVLSYTPSDDYKSIAVTLPSTGDYSLYAGSVLQAHSGADDAVFTLDAAGLQSFGDVQKKADTKITKSIQIDTLKPVSGNTILDGINTAAVGAVLSNVMWSSDSGTTYVAAAGNFIEGKDYRTQYTYTAQSGYVFDSTMTANDIVVTNIETGTKAIELKDNNRILLVTVTWPEGPKLVAYGDFAVFTADQAPSYANHVLSFNHSGSYQLKMKDGVTTTSDRIVVDASTVELTVEDVQVAIPAENVQGAFELRNGSTVHMTLVGDNKFLSGRACPGIMVTPGETLVIDGDGALRAEGLNTAAGIGGSNFGDKQTAGHITINSGSIYAKAGPNNGGGAGIGASADGGAGTILINGGDVTAISEGANAAIGGSANNHGVSGSLTIKNALVKAYGASGGTGIASSDVMTTISNSTIFAVSKSGAAIYGVDNINVDGHMLMANYETIVAADTDTTIMKDGKEVLSYTPNGDYKSIAVTLPASGDYTLYNASVLQAHSGSEDVTFKVENLGLTTFNKVQEMKISDYKIITEIINKLEKLNVEDMLQSEIVDTEMIKNKIEAMAVELANNGEVAILVNELNYKEAVAGSSEHALGSNGYYDFNITASKGNETQVTESKQVIIIATPYIEIPTYSIEGGVEDDSGNKIQNATVRMMSGKEQVGASTQTDADGKFVISAIPNGRYNIVVTKEERISTTLITVDDADYAAGMIMLSSGKKNSTVEVKESTPSIVVGGLEEQFQASTVSDDEKDKGLTTADNNVIAAGGSVEIKFVAEKKDETASNADHIATKATSNNNVIALYLDFSVEKIVKNALGVQDDTLSSKMAEVPSLIDVFIPLETSLQNKSDYKVYRYHGSDVDVITTTENADHEKIEIIDQGNMLKISVKKFSTYAIAYSNPTPSSNTHSNRSETSRDYDEISSVKNDNISIGQSSGGMITKMSDDKTVNIRPNKGYLIADVKVDGMSIGALEQKIFIDNEKHHITATFVKSDTLPYYVQDGEKVYIGFSNINDKSYDYIAPSNAKVEFDEHTMSLEDNTLTWAEDSVKFVVERELLGIEGNHFGINEKVTRAEFMTAIGHLYERSYGEISADMVFEDVDDQADYADYLAWAYQVGIIKGVGDNKFAPDDYLTREQMAVIVNQFIKLLDEESKEVYDVNYGDQNQISDWAIDSVAYCSSEVLIPERYSNLYKPQEEVTRAEVAVTVHRVIQNIMK